MSALALPDRAAILALIPHQGNSCVLDAVLAFDAAHIVCASTSHRRPDNPLRRAGRLSPLALIEYGAQAMAVHAALMAGGQPAPRLLVSAQAVCFVCEDAATIEGGLRIEARHRLADARSALYEFEIFDAAGRQQARGRVGVMQAAQA